MDFVCPRSHAWHEPGVVYGDADNRPPQSTSAHPHSGTKEHTMPRHPLMSAVAGRQTIDCAAATAGGPANGLISVGHPGVTLTDSIDAGQQGGQRHHPQCTGKGRGGTPPVIGILTLAWPAMDLPIAFGTDDPGFSSPGDLALLALGVGGNPVGQAITVMHGTLSSIGP